MNLPRDMFTGDHDTDFDMFRDMTAVANIIWQSQRATYRDCEDIASQVIMHLYKEGYLRRSCETKP